MTDTRCSTANDALRRARQIISDNAVPIATINGGYHRLDLRMDEYQALVEALRGAAQVSQEPQTLAGMIQAVYGNMDAEDCSVIDFEWARQRGYILPNNGTGQLEPLPAGDKDGADMIRAAFLRNLQFENECESTGTPCRNKDQCGCNLEMNGWLEEQGAPAYTWQDISTAPKDGKRILLFQAGRGAFEGWWHTAWPHPEEYWMDDADSEPDPTHWRPTLPIPSTHGEGSK